MELILNVTGGNEDKSANKVMKHKNYLISIKQM